MSKDHEYKPILQDSNSLEQQNPAATTCGYCLQQRQSPKRRVQTFLRHMLLLFAVLTPLAALMTGAELLSRATVPLPLPVYTLNDGFIRQVGEKSCRCGANLQEAIDNGCVYDSLALAWLPAHCRDDELLAEWETAGSGSGGQWEYFRSQNRDDPMNVTEVSMLGGTTTMFYTTLEWHVKHCAFSWRKQYRARITGVTVDIESDGLDHIAHCEKNFLLRGDLQAIKVIAGVTLDADSGGKVDTRLKVQDD